MMLNCLSLFFIHLKLELLTQFPAPNDEKYYYLSKIDISQIEVFDELSTLNKIFLPILVTLYTVYRPMVLTVGLQG